MCFRSAHFTGIFAIFKNLLLAVQPLSGTTANLSRYEAERVAPRAREDAQHAFSLM
jgi:hypothetical protein